MTINIWSLSVKGVKIASPEIVLQTARSTAEQIGRSNCHRKMWMRWDIQQFDSNNSSDDGNMAQKVNDKEQRILEPLVLIFAFKEDASF